MHVNLYGYCYINEVTSTKSNPIHIVSSCGNKSQNNKGCPVASDQIDISLY
jgi:hypothetical protein